LTVSCRGFKKGAVANEVTQKVGQKFNKFATAPFHFLIF